MNLIHWLFGHKWKTSWDTIYLEPLEQHCTRCDEYRHKSPKYSSDPYLGGWNEGKHPHHPREFGNNDQT